MVCLQREHTVITNTPKQRTRAFLALCKSLAEKALDSRALTDLRLQPTEAVQAGALFHAAPAAYGHGGRTVSTKEGVRNAWRTR
jgi:hypothetical protein